LKKDLNGDVGIVEEIMQEMPNDLKEIIEGASS